MQRVVVIIAGAVSGGILGFRSLLPPPPPPDEYVCGLAVLPAMFFGFPVGMVLGGLVGFILMRAIENERRPASSPRPLQLTRGSKRPSLPAFLLWDRELDGSRLPNPCNDSTIDETDRLS